MSFSKLKWLGILCLFTAFPSFAQDKPQLDLGGALRFNYNYSDWKQGHKDKGGDFGYDVFRINAKAKYKGISVDTEFRFYSEAFGGMMLKHGWIGYDFNEKNEIQLGLTQVPFGNLPYNSHNWFFSMNYYVGLEDDYDMGFKYNHQGEHWDFSAAFFKNAEELQFGSTSDVSNSRYSYDVGSIDLNGDGTLQYRNKETNQFNGRLVYKILGDQSHHKLGVSGEYGGLYNLDTQDMGDHYAVAAHYDMRIKRFDLKAQISHYKYNSAGPDGENKEMIAMTAFGAPYMVASEATIYAIGAAYTLPVEWGPICSLQFYNDFSMLDKSYEEYEDSFMNTLGILISAGNVYTYIDYAMGKNQPWLGPDWNHGLAAGNPDAEWSARFNINIGYYF